MTTETKLGHSSNVRGWLVVKRVRHELAQVGPDFCILREPISGDIFAGETRANLLIEVDGNHRKLEVSAAANYLPSSKKVRFKVEKDFGIYDYEAEVNGGNVYYILSGEGEQGTWKKIRSLDINKTLEKERCNGDRWAMAYNDIVYKTIHDEFVGYNIETGEAKVIPTEIVDFIISGSFE